MRVENAPPGGRYYVTVHRECGGFLSFQRTFQPGQPRVRADEIAVFVPGHRDVNMVYGSGGCNCLPITERERLNLERSRHLWDTPARRRRWGID